jgi:integrase
VRRVEGRGASAAPASAANWELSPRLLLVSASGSAASAARASTAGTRRQYASIYRTFATWLAAELGRPPLVADLDADVIAAYGRHLTAGGGRGGAPGAPATVRVYVSMIRALAPELGLKDQAADVRVPRHEPGPPETLTDVDDTNLLRVPDRRSREGKRDYALLRVLGELRSPLHRAAPTRAQDLRRPRANARHFQLYVHGEGGREREVSVPDAVKEAIDTWVGVHPLAKATGLRDEHPLSCGSAATVGSNQSPVR